MQEKVEPKGKETFPALQSILDRKGRLPMIKALVLGELCEDILLHNPAGVEVMGQKTWAKDIVLSAGGSTYYTGAALLHLGADVKISSVLGTDEAGDRVYNQMMLDGLNICHTERLPGRKTTKSMMVCDGGDKQFIGCTPMLPLKIPEWLALKGSDLFYIAGYTLYPELWEEEMVNLCCKSVSVLTLLFYCFKYIPFS